MAFLRRRVASESAASLSHNLFLVRDLPLTSGDGRLRYQLSLEKQLFETCQCLLTFYQEEEDWTAVGQIALTLASNKERIYKLQQQVAPTEGSEMEPDDESVDLPLAVRVKQVFNQDSGVFLYCVEERCTPHGAEPVLHTSDEFKALQHELEAKGLLLREFQIPRGREYQQWSYMLSAALADPVLCRDPTFLRFMASNTTPNLPSGNVCTLPFELVFVCVCVWGGGGGGGGVGDEIRILGTKKS